MYFLAVGTRFPAESSSVFKVMGHDVGIASATAILNHEATGTCNKRGSLQFGLGLAVHDDNNVALEESLVAECGHSLQDVLVRVGTNLDVTSLGHAAERALVLVPLA